MRDFLEDLRPLIFSRETGFSIVLGVISGILLALPHFIGLAMLMGWMGIPMLPSLLLEFFSSPNLTIHTTGGGGFPNPDWVGRIQLGIVFFYILLLCYYTWYAYRTAQQTGLLRDGIRTTLWSALVMTISAIIPTTLTLLWSQSISLSTILWALGSALKICFVFAIPLSIIALLTGSAGALLGKWRLHSVSVRGL